VQELSIGEVNYRTGKLDAFQQFHVFRKLSPILSGLIETFSRARTSVAVGNGNDEESPAANPAFWSAVGPVAHAIAEMSQEDSEYILRTCLGTVMRRGAGPGGNWARLTTMTGVLMFEDLDLGAMLQLTYAVLEDNLGDFFRDGLLSISAAQSLTPSNGSA
jgi:hypothetical protein